MNRDILQKLAGLSSPLASSLYARLTASDISDDTEADTSLLFRLAEEYVAQEEELSGMSQELSSCYEEQVFLYETAAMLNVGMNIEEISSTILARIVELFEAASGSVMLIEDNRLCVKAFDGYIPVHLELPLEHGIAGRVASTGIVEIVNDTGTDERFAGDSSRVKSLLCAPIMSSDRIIGVLNVNDRPGGFTAGDGKLAGTVAEFAGMFIDNARLNREKIEEQRIRDSLSRYLSPYIVNELLSEGDLKLGGHKTEVTVLFADIRGFTSMSERMNPSDIVEQLNEYFTGMVELIFEHGGTLDKFVGDMIMALFGAPVPMEDSESRAVQTAIQMSMRLNIINDEWKKQGKDPFHVGIGIHTGEAVVGNIGSPKHMDFTAIGDSVNMAQRIESRAHGGEILVSRAVYERQKDNFRMEKAGILSVKGKSMPIEAYRVLW